MLDGFITKYKNHHTKILQAPLSAKIQKSIAVNSINTVMKKTNKD